MKKSNARSNRTPSTGYLRTLGLLAATCLTAPSLASAAETAEGATLGEVVVTARRTEENLQKTPVAVTALGAEALRQSQVLNVSDLQRSTPSLVIATGAPSASGFTFVSLRGQGNLQATVSNDPAVAIYVDGVYIPRPSQGLTDLIDLERVEVLRGPQGTLFGRNTPGGAVQIITAGPTQVFEGNVRAEVGNFGTYAGGLTLNVPINDQLAARFVYNGRRHDGYGFDVPLNRDIWDQKSDFFRGKVRYDAGDWDITLTGDYNKLRDNGQFTALKSFAPELFGPGGSFAPFGLFNTLTNSLHTKQNWYTTYATGFAIPVGPVFATLPADVQAVYRRPLGNTLEAYGGSATINGDLGGVHLKSITGYRFSDAQGTVDSDGTPIPILTTWSGYRSKQWSQEFQISGEMGDRFNYIAGVYYSRETGTEFARSQSFGFIPNGGLINQSQLADIKNISKGVFGQGYYKLTDTVRLTGGLRWTWDNRDSVLHSLAILGVPTSCSLTKPDVAGVCAQTQKASFNYPAWTVGVDWQVNDEVFLYAQTRGAAKSGGWNTRQGSLPSFRPAKAKDVELGAKGTFLDNRLRTNFALFYQWQKDVQRNAAALTASGAPTQFVVNAGDARVWGMEFEGSVIPWEGMTVSGSVSLLDGEYKKGSFREPQTVPIPNVPGCIPSPGAAAAVSSICSVDRSREKLPQLPKVQYSIGATQHVPVSIGDLVLHADYSFVGAQSFNPVTVSLLRPAVTQALFAAENRLTRLNHYGLLNARVSLLLENPNIELSVFAKNLTQKKYASRVFSDVYSAGIGMAVEFDGEPRTYGVAATYRFGGGS